MKTEDRPLFMPRLAPGTRVRYDMYKWDVTHGGVRFQPDWATKEWALSLTATVVEESEFPGSIYPATHPWGLPDFATPIRYDGSESVTWVRTSCLDAIGFATKNPQQPELQLLL